MTPMAKPLKNAEMNDVAAYFAAQTMAPPKHKSKPENVAAGPGLAKKFNCSSATAAPPRPAAHPRLAVSSTSTSRSSCAASRRRRAPTSTAT